MTTVLDRDPETLAHQLAVAGLLERGQGLARSGDVSGAVAQFRKALDLDPSVDLNPTTTEPDRDPETLARQLAVAGLVERGQGLARSGDVSGAVAEFRKALDLDPSVDLDPTTTEPDRDPEAVARQSVAASWVERGRDLARSGDMAGAIAQFRKALDLDPSVDLNPTTTEPDRDPEALAKQIAESQSLVREGRDLARTGNIAGAADKFQKAIDLDPQGYPQGLAQVLVEIGASLAREGYVNQAVAAYAEAIKRDPKYEIDANSWNHLCWRGSVNNHAADVLDACESAVKLEPKSGAIRDSRGVARALLGDFKGAIEDFRFFVEWAKTTGQHKGLIPQREGWIAVLQAGRNPLDARTLESIRNQ
jgi:tetratricopeptide (TPR) repeat protein